MWLVDRAAQLIWTLLLTIPYYWLVTHSDSKLSLKRLSVRASKWQVSSSREFYFQTDCAAVYGWMPGGRGNAPPDRKKRALKNLIGGWLHSTTDRGIEKGGARPLQFRAFVIMNFLSFCFPIDTWSNRTEMGAGEVQ